MKPLTLSHIWEILTHATLHITQVKWCLIFFCWYVSEFGINSKRFSNVLFIFLFLPLLSCLHRLCVYVPCVCCCATDGVTLSILTNFDVYFWCCCFLDLFAFTLYPTVFATAVLSVCFFCVTCQQPIEKKVNKEKNTKSHTLSRQLKGDGE